MRIPNNTEYSRNKTAYRMPNILRIPVSIISLDSRTGAQNNPISVISNENYKASEDIYESTKSNNTNESQTSIKLENNKIERSQTL